MAYTDEICTQKQQKIAIYEKAVKNCPKESEFWLSYLRELEKNNVEGDKIQQTAIQAIEQAGDDAGIDFQFEMLKHLCEYYVRALIVPPGEIPDSEGNPVIAQKIEIIRGMYADAMENLLKLNQAELVSHLIDKLKLNWAEVEAYKI